MQLKKIFWSLLVVIMILSTAVFSISAADNALEFSVALGATEDSEGNVVVNPGDAVKVNVTITNNPGVTAFSFVIAYDAEKLEPVTSVDAGGDEFVVFESADGSDFAFIDKTYGYGIKVIEPGKVQVVCNMLTKDSKYTGPVVSIDFTFKADVTGDAVVSIVNGEAFNEDYDNVAVNGGNATLEGHNYDNGTHVPATCFDDEYTIYKCTDANCTAYYTINGTAKATNHVGTTVPMNAVPATCTTSGLTQGSKCTKCNTILVPQETVPATGHTTYVIDAIKATCLADGRTEGVGCAVCKAVITPSTTISATGHTAKTDADGEIVWTVDVAATCSSSGYKHRTCVDCDSKFGYTTVNAIGHNMNVVIDGFAATCTAEGREEGARCDGCGMITKEQKVIDALGHNSDVVLQAVPATCTSIGLTEGKQCSRCDFITVEQTVVEAKGHANDVILNGVEATCTATGLTAGIKCSVCDVITVEQTVISAKGHTEKVLEAVEPTCESIGLTEGKLCTVCGVATVPQNIVAKKGHTEETIPAVDATCTAAGSTEGTKCSVCDVVLDAAEVVQPKGHTEVTIPAVDPTYSEDGSTEGKQCSTCNTITDATGVIPAKSLAWLWVLIGGVVVVGALVAVYFFVLKKKN